MVCRASAQNWGQAASAALAATVLMTGSAQALSYDQLQSLTYLQVKGSGLAAQCPVMEQGSDASALKEGSYRMSDFCMEPTSFTIREESSLRGGKTKTEFVPTIVVTRQTYTLSQMNGSLNVNSDGTGELKEEEGIDFQALTLQLPGGEHAPMLFTIKEVDVKGPLSAMTGEFTVPSYRGSSFMDPKGRGASTGYESAIALQTAQDDDHLEKENIKRVGPSIGTAVFSVAKVDAATGEVAGVFETIQPADSDMGAKIPKDVRIEGLWYARLQ